MITLFIGYDIPLAQEIKYLLVIPELDKHFNRFELDGELVHIIPEGREEQAENIIVSFNESYSIGLTCDFENWKARV